MDATKYCPRCRKELPAKSYGSDRSQPDGKQKNCKRCLSKKYFDKKESDLRQATRNIQKRLNND